MKKRHVFLISIILALGAEIGNATAAFGAEAAEALKPVLADHRHVEFGLEAIGHGVLVILAIRLTVRHWRRPASRLEGLAHTMSYVLIFFALLVSYATRA